MFFGQDMRMPKKIGSALKQLVKALEKHADAVTGSSVSSKKAQRAGARVAAAATAYAEAVHAKTGLGNPFDDMIQPGLEHSTIVSLSAERDLLAKGRTEPVAPVHRAS